MDGPFDLVVEGGVLVTPAGVTDQDLAIRDGRIQALGQPGAFLAARAVARLDARGLHVLPGVVDAHVHFRDPGSPEREDFQSGSRAAVAGGVTTVLDMPNTDPPTDSVEHARDKLLRAARTWCDVGLFGLVADDSEDAIEPMSVARLVVGWKTFLGPTTGGLPVPSEPGLRRAMERIRVLGMRLAVHAEDAAIVASASSAVRAAGRIDRFAHPDARPVAAEVAAIDRIGVLALETGCPVHIVHLSSAQGLAGVERWRDRDVDITCEVSPNHLLLGAEDMATVGPAMRMNPPVRRRSEGHGSALLEGLADGRIDMVASDHAPHTVAAKLAADPWAVPSGAIGVETGPTLILSRLVLEGGHLGLARFAEVTAAAPSRVWGLSAKGRLEPGADADITLWDLDAPWHIDQEQLHGRSRLSPFHGAPVRCRAVATVLRGQVVMRDGEPVGEASGRAFADGR